MRSHRPPAGALAGQRPRRLRPRRVCRSLHPSHLTRLVLDAVSLAHVAGQLDRCAIVSSSPTYVSPGWSLEGTQRPAALAVDFGPRSARSFSGVTDPCPRAGERRPRESRHSAQDAADRTRIAAALLRRPVSPAASLRPRQPPAPRVSVEPDPPLGRGPARPPPLFTRRPATPARSDHQTLSTSRARPGRSQPSPARGAHTPSPIRRPLGLIMVWICPEGARKPSSSRHRPSAGTTRTRTPSSTRLRTFGARPIISTPQQRTIRPAGAAAPPLCHRYRSAIPTRTAPRTGGPGPPNRSRRPAAVTGVTDAGTTAVSRIDHVIAAAAP